MTHSTSSTSDLLFNTLLKTLGARLDEHERRLTEIEEERATDERLEPDVESTPGASEDLLNVASAARRLNVSKRKLWELTKRGAVPVVRIDRSVRYCPDALRRWVEERQAASRA